MLSPTLIVAICFAGLVCVAPLAFYLCWLASVNRRDRPTVVNAAWDFVGLLAALTGFLLIGGLLLRGMVMSHPWLIGHSFHDMQMVFEKQRLVWLALVLGYLLLLGVVLRVAIRSRVTVLSVYNADADATEGAVEASLTQAGLTAIRQGNLWSDDRKLVEVVHFHGTRHVSVRVLCPDRRVREEIERHLRTQLAATPSPDNPAAGWFSAVAGGSVFVVVGFVALLSYIVFFRF